MKRRRDQVLLVRISAAEKLALQKAAAALDVPAAQLVRRAIKDVVSEGQAAK
jgi:hypothetical protein